MIMCIQNMENQNISSKTMFALENTSTLINNYSENNSVEENQEVVGLPSVQQSPSLPLEKPSSALKILLSQTPELVSLFKNPETEKCTEGAKLKKHQSLIELEDVTNSSKKERSPKILNLEENPRDLNMEKSSTDLNIKNEIKTSEVYKNLKKIDSENNLKVTELKNSSKPASDELKNITKVNQHFKSSELANFSNSHALTCNNPSACITYCAITYTLARKKTLAEKRQRARAVVVPACFTNGSTNHQEHQFDRDKQTKALDKLRKSICMTKLVIGTFEMKKSSGFEKFMAAICTKRRTINMINRAAVKICIRQDPDNRWTIVQETTVKAKSSYFGNTKVRKSTLNKFRPKYPCAEMLEDYDGRILETTLVVEGGNRLILMQEDKGDKGLSSVVCLAVQPSNPNTLVVTNILGDIVAEREFTRVDQASPDIILPPQPVLIKSEVATPMEMLKLSTRGL